MFPELKLGLFRLRLVVRQPMVLPPYKGSVLRGGFGSAFRRIACAQPVKDCGRCLLRGACAYAYVFETSPPIDSEALRNLKDVPRPFVIEPPEDNKTTYEPGDEMEFGLILIGRGVSYLPYFLVAFRELGRAGIGPQRAGFELTEARQVGERIGEMPGCTQPKPPLGGGAGEVRSEVRTPTGNPFADDSGVTVFHSGGGRPEIRSDGVCDRCLGEPEVAALAERIPPDRVTVEFQTMTRLKSDGSVMSHPEFSTLVRALLRRESALAYFHHGVTLSLDYRSMIEGARSVRVESANVRWVDWTRHSNRQRRSMNLGGLVGTVTYMGDLRPFRELLALGQVTHVGKNTTFGLGRYHLVAGGNAG